MKFKILSIVFVFLPVILISQESNIILWDYYNDADFNIHRNEIGSLINIPMVGKTPIDGFQKVDEMIDFTLKLQTRVSFSEYSVWQNDKLVNRIFWASIFDDDLDSSVLQINGDLIDQWISIDSNIYLYQGIWIKNPFEDPWQNKAVSFLDINHIIDYLSPENINTIDVVQLEDENYEALIVDLRDISDFFYFQKMNPEWRKNLYIIFEKDTMKLMYYYLSFHTDDENDTAIAYGQSFFKHGAEIQISQPEDYVEQDVP